ncbi:MAG: hypothetical protein PVJ57_13170 [Phycisphaerae bacterium]|jgi:hypothetical protein
MKRRALFLAASCLAVVAVAQPPEEEDTDERPYAALQRNVRNLFEAFRGLSDWDTHRELMIESVEKVYARNGWDSEPDMFSLSLIHGVNEIPPWRPQERFETLIQIVSDRYLLDERQEDVLRNTMVREATRMFMRHSGRIAQYAGEAIRTRAAGEPFTPDQVARWVKLAEPVMEDMRSRSAELSTELMAELDPDQQLLLEADMAAFTRRLDGMQEMAQHWANGEWTPEDWGLEDDPIQLGQLQQPPDTVVEGTEQAPANTDFGRPPPRVVEPPRQRPEQVAGDDEAAGDNDPWAQYVRRFIARYRLNNDQRSRAWKIYRDARTRGDHYRRRFGEQIDAARRRLSVSDDEAARARLRNIETQMQASLDRLFEQLRRRLERIPTRAQRRDAAPVPLEEPQPAEKKPVSPRLDGP